MAKKENGELSDLMTVLDIISIDEMNRDRFGGLKPQGPSLVNHISIG